jgi:outer membrane lipoprotein LolB
VSRLLTVFMVLGLTACTTLPPTPQRTPEELSQLWQQHREMVAQWHVWSLDGRIAVKTEDDGWSGELQWGQSPTNFQIHFSAPFGQGAFQLAGNDHGVEMRFSDGKVFQAPDAESLLQQHLGWQLPLEAFRYWVTGMPAPGTDAKLNFNPDGQLAELQQEQWHISYPAYMTVENVMMPRKIYLKNHTLGVRLVIDHWARVAHE